MTQRRIPDGLMFEVFAVFKDGKVDGLYAKTTDGYGMRSAFVNIIPDLRRMLADENSNKQNPSER